MESETQQPPDAQTAEQPAGDDDPFFEVPPTDIESLKGRLMDSGSFFSFNSLARALELKKLAFPNLSLCSFILSEGESRVRSD